MKFTLQSLFAASTAEKIFEKALHVAQQVGLVTTSWFVGDPTRSLYTTISMYLERLDKVAAQYVSGGYIDLAAEMSDRKWAAMLAQNQFGYTPHEATYATCTVRLTNSGGGEYEVEPGSLVVASDRAEYRSTSGGVLPAGPGTFLDVEVECVTAGSSGGAAVGEVNQIVSEMLGVDVVNITPAFGLDAENARSIAEMCKLSLASRSPFGPVDKYRYVALDQELTGPTSVSRCSARASTTTGHVYITLASASGGVVQQDIDAVTEAIYHHALTLCVTPVVVSAVETTIDLNLLVRVYPCSKVLPSTLQVAVSDALLSMFSELPIGGDGDGKLYLGKVISTVADVAKGQIYDVSVLNHADDIAIANGCVATLGTVAVAVEVWR